MPKFYGKIKNKKLELLNKQGLVSYLSSKDGKDIVLKVGVKGLDRTLQQNSLYWLWLQTLEDWSGTSRNKWHSFFKNQFLEWVIAENDFVPTQKSTSQLTKREMSEYMEKIEVWMRDFEPQFEFPKPDDLYYQ